VPELAPFRAVGYTEAAGSVGKLLAPPYDVIGAEEARELRGRSPYNAVRLVLPEDSEPDRYQLAARRFQAWQEEGVLRRHDRPSLFVYRQTFRRDGEEHTRSGVLGALSLTSFSRGEVLPHEETHRGPKEDRLALMRAVRAQLSPVFLVAPDPGVGIPPLLERGTSGSPILEGTTPDGIRHRLWRVLEGPLADGIRDAVDAAPLLVADGHHRYETGLEMARGTPPGHPARRILACVVSGEDPGLLCLPTHRALSRPPGEGSADGTGGAAAWGRWLEEEFHVTELPEVDSPARGAEAAAGEGSGGAMIAMPGKGGSALLLRPRGETVGAPAPMAFDRGVLRSLYGAGPDAAVEAGWLSYHRDAPAALRAAGPDGAAFLLPPPDVGAVWRTARQGGRLPPKSTYFWPKLPSGLLFRPLDG